MFFDCVLIPVAGGDSDRLGTDNDIQENVSLNHSWTLEEKITLCILANWYAQTWKEHTLIFNAYFHTSETLSSRQRRNLSENCLRTMYWHLMNYYPTNGVKDIECYDTTFSDSSAAWAAARQSLEKIACELGIIVRKRKSTDTLPLSKTPRYARVLKRKRKNHLLDLNYSARTEDLIIDPETRHRIPAESTSVPQNTAPQLCLLLYLSTVESLQFSPSPSLSRKLNRPSQGNIFMSLPRIAFRAFNSSSRGFNSAIGFRAGEFYDTTTIPPPPNTQSPFYRKRAIQHISSVASGPTPFISVTKNLLRAIHHGLKSGSDSSIAVIDLQKVEKFNLRKPDHAFTSVQPVRPLQLESPDGYTGSGEYLIWGEIPNSAVISCVKIAQLLSFEEDTGNEGPLFLDTIRCSKYSTAARNRIKQAQTPLTRRSGQAVGKFSKALGVPQGYHDDAIRSIMRDWRFNESRSRTWRKNKKFIRGIDEGYRTATPNILQLHEKEPGDQSFHNRLQEGITEANLQEIALSKNLLPETRIVDCGIQKETSSQDAIGVQEAENNQLSIMNLDEERTVHISDDTIWSQSFLGQLKNAADI